LLPSSLVVGILILVMLVIYGFIKTMPQADPERKTSRLHYDLKFETSPEIMAYSADDETKQDTIKLYMVDNAWMACWALDGNILGGKKPGDKYELILRIYEAGDMLRHHDIKTDKTNGCCRLYLRTDRAYYVSLGLKQGKNFHPLLVSNTVIPSSLH
jgi:hypothetical protein